MAISKKFFSIKNSEDKTHKIITIFGIKIKISKNIYTVLESCKQQKEHIRDIKYNILRKYYNIIVREGTSDKDIFYQVLVDENYDYQYAKAPEIILDLGANIGCTAIYYAKRFPSAKIYCLEPSLNNYDVLVKNVKNFPNIKTLNAAIYYKDTQLNMFDPGFGAWGLQVSEDKNNTNQYVQAYSFKSLLKKWDLEDKILGIVKIDIEGSEKELFEGNTEWLNNTELMIIETHDRIKFGTSQAIFNVMKDRDFILNIKGEDLVFENRNYRKC